MTSKILGDLLFAPYRIGKLHKSNKAFYFFLLIQIPYIIIPGVLFLLAAILYVFIAKMSMLFLSFFDLLINSKKYKYLEGKEYSEEYLSMDYPIMEL